MQRQVIMCKYDCRMDIQSILEGESKIEKLPKGYEI